MPTPDETAEKVLNGVLGPLGLTFAEFRRRMIDEHPEYLDDEALHGLYVKHGAVEPKWFRDTSKSALADEVALLDASEAEADQTERDRLARQAKAEAHAERCLRNAQRARARAGERETVPTPEPAPRTFSERVRAAWDVLRSRA